MKRLLILLFLPLFAFGQKNFDQLLKRADLCYEKQRFDSAAVLYEQAFAVSTNADPYLLYNAACSYALAGKKGKTFYALNAAIQNGYVSFASIQTDEDFRQIRKDSTWKPFLARLYETAAYASTNFRGQIKFKTEFMLSAAAFWAEAGNNANAFRCLQRITRSQSVKLEELEDHPQLVILHSDPKWKELTDNLKIRLVNERSNFYWGLYFGILCFLVVYNLFLFFSLKENAFLYYALFIFAYVQFEAYRSAAVGFYITDLLIWFKYLPPASSLSMFLTLIAIVFILLFAKSFLNLKQIAPGIEKWTRILVTIFILLIGISFFSDILSRNIVFPLVLATYLFALIMGIYVLIKRYRPARFFVLGMIVMTLTVFWVILASYDIVEQASGISVFHIDNIGTLFFSVILSLAIGDKVNILKQEKESAQAKALEVLEEKVQERTREVVKQKHVVEEKQKEIIDSINYARRIQNSLLPTERYIDKVLQRLNKKK